MGLHFGRTITAAHLGVLGYVLLASRDVGAALLRWQKFELLISDAAHLQARLDGSSLVIEWTDAPEK